MKKTAIFLFIALVMCITLISCGEEAPKYNVTFDTNGGQMYTVSQDVELNGFYSLPVPKKVGYRFLGWYDGETLVNSEGHWSIEGDVTLTAKWEFMEYTITYDLKGGVHSTSSYATGYNAESEEITVPAPKKDGNIFSHWVDQNGKNYGKTIVIPKGSEGDLHFTAVWWNFVDENGIKYKYSDGELTIISYEGTAENDILISDTIHGVKVTAIAENAFSELGEMVLNHNWIYRVYIPRTIEVIEENAFADCDNVKVTIVTNKDEDYDTVAREWLDKVIIEKTGNENLRDVIMLKRASLGSSKYVEFE